MATMVTYVLHAGVVCYLFTTGILQKFERTGHCRGAQVLKGYFWPSIRSNWI